MTTGNDPTLHLGVTMPWPDLGVVCCLSGVPGEVRERSFWLKEVSLSLTCSGNYYYYYYYYYYYLYYHCNYYDYY